MYINIHPKVSRFIQSLETTTYAKTLRTIDFLERFGPALREPYSKPIGRGIFELRIRGQQEVRLLYSFLKGQAVILHGFIKKSQRTPARELETGLQRMKQLDEE